MTMPVEQTETQIHNGRVVRPGDKVDLLPIDLREKDERSEELFAQEDFDFLKKWLGGTGPFTISWIGQWPCGKIILFFKGGSADGAGIYASEFM